MKALHHLMTLLPYGAYTQFVSQPAAQRVSVLMCSCATLVGKWRDDLPVIQQTDDNSEIPASPVLTPETIKKDPTGPTEQETFYGVISVRD